jgi:hypothetical protein
MNIRKEYDANRSEDKITSAPYTSNIKICDDIPIKRITKEKSK